MGDQEQKRICEGRDTTQPKEVCSIIPNLVRGKYHKKARKVQIDR